MSMYTTLFELNERYEKYYRMANQYLIEGKTDECELYRNLAKYYKDRIVSRRNKVQKRKKTRDNTKINDLIKKYPPQIIDIDFSILRNYLFKYVDDAVVGKHYNIEKIVEIKNNLNKLMDDMKENIKFYSYIKIMRLLYNVKIDYNHPDKTNNMKEIYEKCDIIYNYIKKTTYFLSDNKNTIHVKFTESLKYTFDNYGGKNNSETKKEN